MRHFFITGLPRSRTAWAAAFLSTGNVFCHHEALKYAHTEALFRDKMGESTAEIVGNADCGLMWFPVEQWFSGAPIAIIERDPDDVIHSLMTLYNTTRIDRLVEIVMKSQSRLREYKGALRINYYRMNEYLEPLWAHCVGGGFDRLRAEQFCKLNIQSMDLDDLEAGG